MLGRVNENKVTLADSCWYGDEAALSLFGSKSNKQFQPWTVPRVL